jgi:hypothetical protein
METGSDNGNDWRPELAAVSGAMPYEPGQPRFDVSAHLSVRLPFPMVAARGPSFCNGVKRRRRPKRYETMREPMERRQGGGNDRRPELATVSGAMPYAPRLRRRALGGGCAGSYASPRPSARLSVRLSVPVVAAVGSSFHSGRARNSASRRIHDRARGACTVPVGHHRMGQHANAHLPLFGNALLRANPKGRVYVRGRRSRRRISRHAEPSTRRPEPFGLKARSGRRVLRSSPRSTFITPSQHQFLIAAFRAADRVLCELQRDPGRGVTQLTLRHSLSCLIDCPGDKKRLAVARC